MNSKTCVATWLVIDTELDATSFPSVGTNSASSSFQETYWRCIAVFFLTSRIHNPDRNHILFSNVVVEESAPPHILSTLKSLNVDFKCVDITYRLPAGSVERWGNQFYVLDIIKYFAEYGEDDALVLTDSDCIWRAGLSSFEDKIFDHECLLYTLEPSDQKNYEIGQSVNGLSHRRMKEIVEQNFNVKLSTEVQYHGGEFFAATKNFCKNIVGSFPKLWEQSCLEANEVDSIKEEAHFLSIIAESRGVKHSTANGFVRRMWTNFEDFNLVRDDLKLAIWHLPAEKKYGFRRLWHWLSQSRKNWDDFSTQEINQITAQYMGVPNRDKRKLMLDLKDKIAFRLKLKGHEYFKRFQSSIMSRPYGDRITREHPK